MGEGGGGEGAVLFCLPCQLFFLPEYFFSTQNKEGGGALSLDQPLLSRIVNQEFQKVASWLSANKLSLIPRKHVLIL